MATEVLLETSYLLGWHRENDELRPKAEIVKKALAEAQPLRIVLDCVYSELVAVLAKVRVKEEKRPLKFLKEMRGLKKTYWDGLVWMAYIGGEKLLERAIGVTKNSGEKYGAGISLHDAMILIFAHEREIPFVVSFDEELKKIETIEGDEFGATIVDDKNAQTLLK